MTTFDTAYYRVERTPITQDARLHWRGKATILRKDSGEVVDRVSVKEGESPEAVVKRLDEVLYTKLSGLTKPLDWGKDSTIPALISRYLTLRDRSYGFVLEAEKAPAEVMAAIRERAKAFETAEVNALKQDIEKLSEAQKIALVSPGEQPIENREDPWVLDILTAKERLYALIDHPSPEVKAGYRALVNVLSAE